MSKVVVSTYTISLDGFGAGPNQSLENPLGKGCENLHNWMFHTRMFQRMMGKEVGKEEGIYNGDLED